MQSTVEPLEGNKVKLTVAVEAAELDKAMEVTAKKLAREVRMPGFRPGKVPRRVLEARLGHGTLRQETLRDALPDFYASAVREHDVDVIAAPEIDITGGEEDGDLRFDAVVEVRPIVAIPGYAGLQVTVERPGPTDEDIERQVDRLRDNDAALEDVSRPAKDGDVVTIDLGMTAEGNDPNSLTDVSYTVGSDELGVPTLDEQLQGARVGDIIKFTSPSPSGLEIAYQLLLKAVREKRLPDLTDEWVDANTEFDTVTALQADLRTRIGNIKRVQSLLQMREKSLEALAELVTDDAPGPLVEAEVERRVHDLGHRLEAQGATLGQYLSAIGQEPEAFVEELRASCVPSVKADLALRALADAEEIEATEEDVDNEIARIASQAGVPVAQVRANLVTQDQLSAVRSDIRKAKALTWLTEHVDVVDPDGQPIDRAELEPNTPDEPSEEEHPEEDQ